MQRIKENIFIFVRYKKQHNNFTMNRYLLIIATILFCTSGLAQSISFEEECIDAGTTLWNKPITATFKFTNKERQPLVIKDIDGGCGCINADWDKKPIGKGEEGNITITYDAKILGHFERIIEIFTNADDEPVQISIKGNVSNGNKETASELYDYRIGDIFLSSNNIEFPDVRKGDSVSTEIEIMNAGDEVYTPVLMHLPAYITAEVEPKMLARGRRGKIKFTLHGNNLKDMGLTQSSIYLQRQFGDKVSSENEIVVSAVLIPETTVDQNSTNAPGFVISSNILDLGKLGKKSKISGKIHIYNKGTEKLQLINVQAFNQALSVNIPKREIAPGESVKMKITLHTKYLGLSKAVPRVLIITNDANNPKETVTVKYE